MTSEDNNTLLSAKRWPTTAIARVSIHIIPLQCFIEQNTLPLAPREIISVIIFKRLSTHPPDFIRNRDDRIKFTVFYEKCEATRLSTWTTTVHDVMRLILVILSSVIQLESEPKCQSSGTLFRVTQAFTWNPTKNWLNRFAGVRVLTQKQIQSGKVLCNAIIG